MIIGVVAIRPVKEKDLTALKLSGVSTIKISLEDYPPATNLDTHYQIVAQPDPVNDYIDYIYDRLCSAYEDGARHFDLHRFPNVENNGFGWAWRDGAEFASWWVELRSKLGVWFPEAKWGYPALKAGGGVGRLRGDSEAFLRASEGAVEACDYISDLYSWSSSADCLDDYNTCLWRMSDRLRYDKPLMVEYMNPSAVIKKSVKAKQYTNFLSRCQSLGIAGAYCHILSSDVERDKWLTWRGESTGKPNVIPKKIGEWVRTHSSDS
jgi:hypothetical protein